MALPQEVCRAKEPSQKRRAIDLAPDTQTSEPLSQLSRHESPISFRNLPHSPLSEGSLFDISVRRSSAQPPGLQAHRTKATVHRCRFVDYTPGTITALACTPPTWDPSPHFGFPGPVEQTRGVLAVGRGNGDVEIWVWLAVDDGGPACERKKTGSTQGWVLYRTLPGHIPSASSSTQTQLSSTSASKIEQLVFAHQISPVDCDVEADEMIAEVDALSRALPRLFGTNGGEEVLEWEWDGSQAGIIKRTLPMPPSIAVWSLAVCPQSKILAIGCDDGTIRLASIADNQLELIRKFDPCKSRLLCVAWGMVDFRKKPRANGKPNGKARKNINSSTFVVAGCADSSLRKWDVNTGRCVGRMPVDKLQGEQTLVWTVAVIEKFIVSGDSLGNVNFWDPASCTRVQTIRAHRADILCLVASPDGNEVFTSGVDQKTCQLTLINNRIEAGKPDLSKWILSAWRRLHSHDVRALAMSPPYVPPPETGSLSSEKVVLLSHTPVLISGGLDMSLVLCSAASPLSYPRTFQIGGSSLPPNPISDSSIVFGDSICRKISYATRRVPVCQLSPHCRLLVCRRDRGISIWRLPSREAPEVATSYSRSSLAEPETAWHKVVDMELKCQTNLVTSAVSPDGKWLSVSDLYEVKLFSLNCNSEGDLQPRRVKSFVPYNKTIKASAGQQGASSIHFSPDSTRMIFATAFTSQIIVVGLDPDSKECRVLRVFNQHRTRLNTLQSLHRVVIPPPTVSPPSPIPEDSPDGEVGHSNEERPSGSTITAMAISSDCQWLASVDSTKVLHVFNLDLLKHHCILPTSSVIVNCLSFSSSTPSTLVIGYADNSLQVMNVESRRMPEWAQKLCANPPAVLSQLRDTMLGIAFEPHVERDERSGAGCNSSISSDTRTHIPHTIFLWGANWTCKISLPEQPNLLGTSRRPKRPRQLVDLLAVDEGLAEFGTGSETATEMGSVEVTVKVDARVTHKYQAILLLDFLGPEEMVIVERPFLGLLAHLPPAWVRTGAYGT
ncbi:hypothetical protein CROQUDRAFT_662108 [Cronartium quercuum f. sp. fusiforme G11]|uniref:Uncharacterized protein n=1 Tax=Cronartium quercuum f. sp. fusiforme G11 TaxID=708437 RepID=A0A9P6NBB3_9BASI|nr:hypothetical protein CROQUDRAFT_662108 [Cronartium quercuum f. sp. fusiforme G11]